MLTHCLANESNDSYNSNSLDFEENSNQDSEDFIINAIKNENNNNNNNNNNNTSATDETNNGGHNAETKPLPRYYMRNFFLVLDSVLREHSHIFVEEEKTLFNVFKNDLDEEAQKLYIRLFQRKGPWFRIAQLHKSYSREMPNLDQACETLQQRGFVTVCKTVDNNNLDVMLSLLTLQELREIAKNFVKSKGNSAGKSPNQNNNKKKPLIPLAPSSFSSPFSSSSTSSSSFSLLGLTDNINKNQLIQSILEHRNQRNLFGEHVIIKMIGTKYLTGGCLRLSEQSLVLFERVNHLFFLNDTMQQNVLLLVDMQKVTFPSYTCNKQHAVFATREDFLNYEKALHLDRLFEDSVRNGDEQKAVQLLNSATKWLLHTCDPLRDPFQHLNTKHEADTADAPKVAHNLLNMSDSNDSSNGAKFRSIHEEFSMRIPTEELYEATCDEETKKCFAVVKSPAEIKQLVAEQPFLCRFTVGWIFAGIVYHAIPIFERSKQYSEAILYYRVLLSSHYMLGRRGKWYNRLAINLEHLGRKDDSLVLSEAAISDPAVRTGALHALTRRVLRLAKPPRRWKKPACVADINLKQAKEVYIEGVLLNSVTGVKSQFVGKNDEPVTVETLALEHYNEVHGFKGHHCENGIWMSLFGIFMWDIIFMDVPDVFQTAFQDAPLDLSTDAFYNSRVTAIDTQLKQLFTSDSSQLLTILEQAWTHKGVRCRGLNWDGYEYSDLQEIVVCIGGKVLAAVFALFAEDFNAWCGGLPDLLLWNPETGVAKAVEVKGPRDRLSDKQRVWIDELLSAGIEVELCHVREASD